jgi:hypothetical protein
MTYFAQLYVLLYVFEVLFTRVGASFFVTLLELG